VMVVQFAKIKIFRGNLNWNLMLLFLI
jgi:hypothetical protein